VDPLSRRQFWDLIGDLRRERPTMSVVISTAYMDEAGQCDWLIAMDHACVWPAAPRTSCAQRRANKTWKVFAALQPGQKSAPPRLVIAPRQPGTEAPVIVARNLTRRFGSFTAVDRVSFAIERGKSSASARTAAARPRP
jgi:ribosome-dependent ATPase